MKYLLLDVAGTLLHKPQHINKILGNVFSDIFVSEYFKHALQFYQIAINKIGSDEKDIFYIGDSFKLDIQPAIQAGMKAYIIDRDNLSQ